MNYSWIAYENGLQLLLRRIPQDHCEYENVFALQVRLRQNITQAKSHGDLEALYAARKRILSDLNNLAMQVTEDSFIQFGIASCCLFKYLAHVYEAVHKAHVIFRDEYVWPDQCQWIIGDFRKRPALAETTKGVTESTRVALYHIDARIVELILLVEEYERVHRQSSKRIGNRHNEVIRQLNMFLEEIQKIDNESFKEFIEWYQEAIFSTNASQALLTPIDEYSPLTEVRGEPEQQAQELAQQPAFLHREEPSQQSTRQHEEVSPSEEEIDQTALREAIVHAFTLGELRTLCADITQALRKENIRELLNLEILEGTDLYGKAQSFIDYLNRRGLLSYLVAAVRRARPHLKF